MRLFVMGLKSLLFYKGLPSSHFPHPFLLMLALGLFCFNFSRFIDLRILLWGVQNCKNQQWGVPNIHRMWQGGADYTLVRILPEDVESSSFFFFFNNLFIFGCVGSLLLCVGFL